MLIRWAETPPKRAQIDLRLSLLPGEAFCLDTNSCHNCKNSISARMSRVIKLTFVRRNNDQDRKTILLVTFDQFLSANGPKTGKCKLPMRK